MQEYLFNFDLIWYSELIITSAKFVLLVICGCIEKSFALSSALYLYCMYLLGNQLSATDLSTRREQQLLVLSRSFKFLRSSIVYKI